jgi:tetratricopeptide (TPR) repeat protein
MLLAGGVYLNALHNPFVYDDFWTVADNGSIVSLRDPSAIVMYDTTRPLTNASFALDRAVWGVAPFGFHLTNVILHVLDVALIFALVSQLCGDARRQARVAVLVLSDAAVATIAALLFAVHPLMTEAVGYVSGRADLLCASVFLLAVLASRRWVTAGGATAFLAVWLFWAFALLCKETAAVLPPVVLLYGVLFAPRPGTDPAAWSRLRRLATPLVAAMLVAVAARVSVFLLLEHGDLGISAAGLDRIAAAFALYVRLAVIPAGQTIFHGGDADGSHTWLFAAIAAGALLALSALLRRRSPLVVFGCWWFAVLIAPSVLLAATHPDIAVAEHREYLPFAGVAMSLAAAAAGAARYTQRFASTRVLAPIAAAAIVLLLGGWTLLRNMVWADPISLWEEAVRLSPGHWLPYAALGESLHSADRHEEAVIALRASIAIRPENEMTAVDLAVCLAELGQTSEAEAALADLERRKPRSPVRARRPGCRRRNRRPGSRSRARSSPERSRPTLRMSSRGSGWPYSRRTHRIARRRWTSATSCSD